MSIVARLALTPELRDTTSWPAPSELALKEEDVEIFHLRRKAVVGYLEGMRMAKISEQFGMSKSQVYRMLGRCITVKGDGEIFGFFALIPGYPVSSYKRKNRPSPATTTTGLAGAFGQLMCEQDDLRSYVEHAALRLRGKSPILIARAIQAEFMKRCAKVRAPNEYPFNTIHPPSRALVNYVHKFLEARFTSEERVQVIDEQAMQPLTAQPSSSPNLRPYEETEHDGHNGDFYFVVKTPGLRNEWVYTTPMRLWLLLLVDRASRAILGYSYRIGSTNYSAVAVMRSIKHALTKWEPKELTLPHLQYKLGAGLPSGVCPLGHGRLIDLVCFDNAMANRAGLTTRTLTQAIGATLNFGRVGSPIARPFVERLNQTLETLGFRRLPTGFNPSGSGEEREKALKAACEHAMTIEELEQVVDVMLANYNADPHSSLINRSPNEFIRMWDERNVSPIRMVHDPKTIASRLMRWEILKIIRGGGKGQRTPYVEYSYARYTNDVLSKMTAWHGLKIRLVVDIDGDIRLIRGFVMSGKKEINVGILRAEPPWHLTPHTLQQRQLIQRESKIRKIVTPPGTDMVQAFRALKLREATDRKSAANQLVKAGHIHSPISLTTSRPDAIARIGTKDWIKLKP